MEEKSNSSFQFADRDILILVCAAWVGTLAMMNVRERKQEIGILRALGYSAGKITALFLGKALLLGILGAVLGFIIGTALSLKFGPEILSHGKIN